LVADGFQRVERCHRLLEYHRDTGASDPAELVLSESREVSAAEADRTTRDGYAGRQKPHDRVGGHGLSGSALADNAKDFGFR
jgi:hypothetical protein